MAESFTSVNPGNGELIQTFPLMSSPELEDRLRAGKACFGDWSRTPISERAKAVERLIDLLRRDRDQCAHLISEEMGKPLSQAKSEIDKCIWLCEYYVDKAPGILSPRKIAADGAEAWVRYLPTGMVLGIMPWNFPFWQTFRYAIPSLLAGNVVLLKPAPNVPRCGIQIESLLDEALGRPGLFQTLLISTKQVEEVIQHPLVSGVALTGSDRAGSAVASLAGKHLKKCVMELGGSDPFVVLEKADVEAAASAAVQARMNNNGQTCIAAKRWIVHEAVAGAFQERVIEEIQQLKMGYPLEEKVDISCLARPDLVKNLQRQLEDSLIEGAEVLVEGGPVAGLGNYFQPVLITNIPLRSPAYREELFGPVACLFTVPDAKTALQLANDTPYGLGASVWSKDEKEALAFSAGIRAGAIAINEMLSSDPRLPFGGVKRSGFGRELGPEGIREFVNIQSIKVAQS